MGHQRGATTIELTFVILLFFAVIVFVCYSMFAFYRVSYLSYAANLAVRQAIIESYKDDLDDPSPYIQAELGPGRILGGMKVSELKICLLGTLPACNTTPVPQGQLFMVRVQAAPDPFARFMGTEYVAWVLTVNSNPIGVESVI